LCFLVCQIPTSFYLKDVQTKTTHKSRGCQVFVQKYKEMRVSLYLYLAVAVVKMPRLIKTPYKRLQAGVAGLDIQSLFKKL